MPVHRMLQHVVRVQPLEPHSSPSTQLTSTSGALIPSGALRPPGCDLSSATFAITKVLPGS
jgi:hypothetical protein